MEQIGQISTFGVVGNRWNCPWAEFRVTPKVKKRGFWSSRESVKHHDALSQDNFAGGTFDTFDLAWNPWFGVAWNPGFTPDPRFQVESTHFGHNGHFRHALELTLRGVSRVPGYSKSGHLAWARIGLRTSCGSTNTDQKCHFTDSRIDWNWVWGGEQG